MRRAPALLVLAACLLPCSLAVAEEIPDPFESWQYGDRGRLEIGVGAAGITNDPFVRRGGPTLRVGIHLFEAVAIDLRFFIMPDGGDKDLKGLTHMLMATKEVVPDISRMLFAFTPGVLYTPLHVEDWGIGALDFSLFVGGGIVYTEEDEELIFVSEEYGTQVHPAFTYGVNLRIKLADVVAFSLMPQVIHHDEEVERYDFSEGPLVESKANLMLNAQISFLTPER